MSDNTKYPNTIQWSDTEFREVLKPENNKQYYIKVDENDEYGDVTSQAIKGILTEKTEQTGIQQYDTVFDFTVTDTNLTTRYYVKPTLYNYTGNTQVKTCEQKLQECEEKKQNQGGGGGKKRSRKARRKNKRTVKKHKKTKSRR